MMDNLIVGVRQTRKSLQKGEAVEVLVASDADIGITGPIKDLCAKKNVRVVEYPTMAELGRYCSIEIGASVACRRK